MRTGPLAALLLLLGASPSLADDLLDTFDDAGSVDRWTNLQLVASLTSVGDGAALWTDHPNQTSIRRTFAAPRDASSRGHLSLLVHSAQATGAGLQLGLTSESESTEGPDYYSVEVVVDWEGWRHLRVPLESFGAARSPRGWDQLDSAWIFASGWGHEPDPATELGLDDLRLNDGLVGVVEPSSGPDGDDFVSAWVLRPAGGASLAGLGVETLGADAFPGTVTLDGPDAGGAITVQARLTSDALAAHEPLDAWSFQVLLTDATGVRDGFDAEVVVPLPSRPHPRLLLDAAGVQAVLERAAAEPWAAQSLEALLDRAELALERHEAAYGVAGWTLPLEGGQWSAYAVCPDHGVSLRLRAGVHSCPVDDALWTGFPYDQVVYGRRLRDASAAALRAGLAWQLSGDLAHAETGRTILAAFAAAYPGYALHDRFGGTGGAAARLGAQTLDEAGMLLQLAWAWDLLADAPGWTEAEVAAVEHDLLRASAATVLRNDAGISNWQSWHNAGVGAARRMVASCRAGARPAREARSNRPASAARAASGPPRSRPSTSQAGALHSSPRQNTPSPDTPAACTTCAVGSGSAAPIIAARLPPMLNPVTPTAGPASSLRG